MIGNVRSSLIAANSRSEKAHTSHGIQLKSAINGLHLSDRLSVRCWIGAATGKLYKAGFFCQMEDVSKTINAYRSSPA
jgi:hypothetical protein